MTHGRGTRAPDGAADRSVVTNRGKCDMNRAERRRMKQRRIKTEKATRRRAKDRRMAEAGVRCVAFELSPFLEAYTAGDPSATHGARLAWQSARSNTAPAIVCATCGGAWARDRTPDLLVKIGIGRVVNERTGGLICGDCVQRLGTDGIVPALAEYMGLKGRMIRLDAPADTIRPS